MSIHFGLAIAVKAPELQLNDAEAKQYAESIALVARHYDVGASAKTLDWFNLGTAMVAIYGTRFMMIADRRRRERAQPEGGYQPGMAPQTQPEPSQGDGEVVDWSLMRGNNRPN